MTTPAAPNFDIPRPSRPPQRVRHGLVVGAALGACVGVAIGLAVLAGLGAVTLVSVLGVGGVAALAGEAALVGAIAGGLVSVLRRRKPEDRP